MYTCTHVSIFIYTYNSKKNPPPNIAAHSQPQLLYMYLCIYTNTCTYIDVYMYTCTYIYVYIYLQKKILHRRLFHTYEWVMSHIRVSHVTHIRVIAHTHKWHSYGIKKISFPRRSICANSRAFNVACLVRFFFFAPNVINQGVCRFVIIKLADTKLKSGYTRKLNQDTHKFSKHTQMKSRYTQIFFFLNKARQALQGYKFLCYGYCATSQGLLDSFLVDLSAHTASSFRDARFFFLK